MNLHRSSAKADWETTAPHKWNAFQKIAAATKGLVTPANVVTFVGFGLVVYGLYLLATERLWAGLLVVTVGRLLDILDGILAEATSTKSPLGELFDAAADKIGTFLTVLALVSAEVASWWVLAILIVPQLVIVVIIALKKRKNIRIHPTRPGKLSMAFVWASIAGLIISKALGDNEILSVSAYVFAGLSFVAGIYAAWQYATGRSQL